MNHDKHGGESAARAPRSKGMTCALVRLKLKALQTAEVFGGNGTRAGGPEGSVRQYGG